MTTRKSKKLTTKVTSRIGTNAKQYAVARREGYRSGLEVRVASQLDTLGVAAEYEAHTFRYEQPAKLRRYTPDFVLPNGIVVETKGQFKTADRQKHKYIAEQFPDLDVRFVFDNPNTKLRKGSPTSYAKWCDKEGFKYAKKVIPQSWIDEPLNVESMRIIEQFKKENTKG